MPAIQVPWRFLECSCWSQKSLESLLPPFLLRTEADLHGGSRSAHWQTGLSSHTANSLSGQYLSMPHICKDPRPMSTPSCSEKPSFCCTQPGPFLQHRASADRVLHPMKLFFFSSQEMQFVNVRVLFPSCWSHTTQYQRTLALRASTFLI